MDTLENKKIFSNNLKYYMEIYGKTRGDLCRDLKFKYTTFADWYTGKIYPSIDKIELIANYFNIKKSDLIEIKKDTTSNNQLFLIPILGRVPAGEPLLADENIEGYLPIDPSMYGIDRPDGFFFLVVQGESMNKVVTNGAYVLVKKQNYCDDNDVIVAIVNGDDEVTLKRFKDLGNGFIELKPESTYSEFSSRIINTKDTSFKILGKVIGDFKKW